MSDPHNITQVGGYDTPELARGIAISGQYAYVADRDDYINKIGSLLIFDISDPANPVLVNSYDYGG